MGMSEQTDPTTAAPMACIGQQEVPVAQQALPCLLGQKSSSPFVPEKPRDSISTADQVKFSKADSLPNGQMSFTWSLDGRKLKSAADKQLLSHEFIIDFPERGPQPFRMMAAAKQMTRHKGGQTFAKAHGRSKLFVKCAGSVPEDICSVAFKVTIGKESRGPFWHQFADQSCCDLQATDADWDLLASLGNSRRLEVRLEVVAWGSSNQD